MRIDMHKWLLKLVWVVNVVLGVLYAPTHPAPSLADWPLIAAAGSVALLSYLTCFLGVLVYAISHSQSVDHALIETDSLEILSDALFAPVSWAHRALGLTAAFFLTVSFPSLTQALYILSWATVMTCGVVVVHNFRIILTLLRAAMKVLVVKGHISYILHGALPLLEEEPKKETPSDEV